MGFVIFSVRYPVARYTPVSNKGAAYRIRQRCLPHIPDGQVSIPPRPNTFWRLGPRSEYLHVDSFPCDQCNTTFLLHNGQYQLMQT